MDNKKAPIRRLLFVINPVSGNMDKRQAKSAIKEFCPARQWEYRLMNTTGEQDEERIKAAIAEYEPDTVVAGGGDGTVNLVAKTLINTAIKLGILPLGSANGLATEFDISTNVQEALDVLENGKAVPMDVLKINRQHYCFHLADIGYNAKMIQHLEGGKELGQWSYILEFFRTMKERPATKVQIKLPDRQLKQKVAMITFANARRYGTGAVVNPDGKINDGKLEVCVFKPWPRWYLLWLGFHFFIGRLDESDYVDIYPAESVEIEAKDALPLQSDGELLGEMKSVKVAVAEETIEVWVPEGY